jgi:hypothetical protein
MQDPLFFVIVLSPKDGARAQSEGRCSCKKDVASRPWIHERASSLVPREGNPTRKRGGNCNSSLTRRVTKLTLDLLRFFVQVDLLLRMI